MDSIKPYCKIVQVVAATTKIVELRDSNGNALACNYINVINSDGITHDGWFAVVPSASTNNFYDYDATHVSGTLEGSGWGGFLGTANKDVEFVLRNSTTSAIQIRNEMAVAGNPNFIINYGVMINEPSLSHVKLNPGS